MPGYLRPHTQRIVPNDSERSRLADANGADPNSFWVELTFAPHTKLLVGVDENLHSALGGDSHFQVHEPLADGETTKQFATFAYGAESPLNYFAFCNSAGRMSHMNVLCSAADAGAAVKLVKGGVEPLLAHLCITFNAPVNVSRIRVIQGATGITYSTVFHQAYPIVDAPADGFGVWVAEDFRAIRFYREALSATSPKYQLLCYYKVLELLLDMQAKRAPQANPSDAKARVSVERFREEPWLRIHIDPSLLDRIRDKKYTWIKTEVLRPVRDKVAHALLKESDGSWHSDEEVVPYLPIAKRMAENLIRQHQVTLRYRPPVSAENASDDDHGLG